MDWWDKVEWSSMHSPTTTFPKVPLPLQSALATLRERIAHGAAKAAGTAEEVRYLKAFFFLDRLLFSSIKSRGGKRGQKGESISTAISRRICHAWGGEWERLWEDSASPSARNQKSSKESSAQILARDVKSIQEALGDDDIRAAMRIVDGRQSMAPEQKALNYLPSLFPTAPLPTPAIGDPDPDDIARFEEELIKAYRYAPRKRGAGPGGTLWGTLGVDAVTPYCVGAMRGIAPESRSRENTGRVAWIYP